MTDSIHCHVEVVAKGNALEMGIAQGSGLLEKIGRAAGVLEKLDGFRMVQPPWLPYALYRKVAEQRASRFIESSLMQDFPEAYSRMKGIAAGAGVTIRSLELLHALEPMLCDVSRCSVVPAFAAC